jgi:hypothetical protein
MRTTRGELPKFLAVSLLVASCSGRLTVLTSEDGGGPDGNGGSGATGNGNTTTVGVGGATTGAGGATGGSGGDDTTTSGGAGGTTIGAGGAGAAAGSGSGGSAATGAGGSAGIGGAAGGGAGGIGGTGVGGVGGLGTGGGGVGGAAGGSGGTAADGGGMGGTGTGGTDGGVCVAQHRIERRVPPADLMVIADSSLSMDCPVGPIGKSCTVPNADAGPTSDRTRFQILRDALTKLSIDQHLRDGAVGVLFSPFAGATGESCAASDYTTPAAPISLLSDDIVKAFAQQPRRLGSVLSASIQGAFDYVAEYRRVTPYNRIVNLAVVLDGNDATSCADEGALAEKIATIAAGYSPPMRTTAIGLGVELPALERVARAGATHRAHVIDTSALATEEITSSLWQRLRGAMTTCNFSRPLLPRPSPIPDDYVNVDVWYSDFGQWRRQPMVNTAADCGDGDGWYAPNPMFRSSIVLCPKTCSELGMHSDPAVAFESGCPTEIRP